MMGGYDITEWGETNVDGLFACGEVTRSVHGANRLGGNSIAEGQVFGRRAGMRASEYVRRGSRPSISKGIIDESVEDMETFLKRQSGIKTTEILTLIKDVMWHDVGIIRDAEKLQRAQREIINLKREAKSLSAGNIHELQSCLEIRDMLKVAEVIILAALERTESRGAHYRADYPQMDPAWEKNIRVYKEKDGKLATEVVTLVKE
jgi:fumarate reductase (CoM/CoB) subunit A